MYKTISIRSIELYVASILILYSCGRFIPTLRLSSFIYLDLARIIIIVYFVAILIALVFNRKRRKLNSIDYSVLALYFILAISVFWSEDKYITGRRIYILGYSMLFYFTIVFSKKKIRAEIVAIIVPLALLPVSINLYMKYGTLRLSQYIDDDLWAVVGTFGNYSAATVILLIPFGLYHLSAARWEQKLLAGASLVASLIIVILSGSRGAAIIGMLMIAVYFIVLRVSKKELVHALLVILLIVGLVNVVKERHREQSRSSVVDRIVETIDNYHDEVRAKVYEMDIQLILQSPVLGYGFGTHGLLAYNEGLTSNDIGIGSHNMFFTIMLGAGIFGAVSFGVLGYNLIIKLWVYSRYQATNEEKYLVGCLMIAIMAGVTHSMFRPGIDNPNLYFLFAMGSVLIQERRTKNCFSRK